MIICLHVNEMYFFLPFTYPKIYMYFSMCHDIKKKNTYIDYNIIFINFLFYIFLLPVKDLR